MTSLGTCPKLGLVALILNSLISEASLRALFCVPTLKVLTICLTESHASVLRPCKLEGRLAPNLIAEALHLLTLYLLEAGGYY